MTGWVKIQRQMLDWEWFTHPQTAHLFQYCLLRANFKDEEWRGQLVKRGEFVTSRNQLCKATGLTEREVRTSLERLQRTGEIACQTTNRFTTITVQRYEKYQGETMNDSSDSEKSKKPTPPSPFDFLEALVTEGVDRDVAADWVQFRKSKKAPGTLKAFKVLKSEISKSGWSWNRAISHAFVKEWRGFRANWVTSVNESFSEKENLDPEVEKRIKQTLKENTIE